MSIIDRMGIYYYIIDTRSIIHNQGGIDGRHC